MMKAFDAPSREECTHATTSVQHSLAALVLLNDPTFIEAAKAFTHRIIKHGGTSATNALIMLLRSPFPDHRII